MAEILEDLRFLDENEKKLIALTIILDIKRKQLEEENERHECILAYNTYYGE